MRIGAPILNRRDNLVAFDEARRRRRGDDLACFASERKCTSDKEIASAGSGPKFAKGLERGGEPP
jgi:hypothetical protein